MKSQWQPTSLFLRTEFIFWREHSVMEDVGDALVVTTPQNPSWHWGNLIVLKNVPQSVEVAKWRELYEQKIAHLQIKTHRLMVWDDPLADPAIIEEYEKDNLVFSPYDILVLNSLSRSENHSHKITIQEIGVSDSEWNNVIDANTESFITPATPNYGIFIEQRVADYRPLIAKGIGKWYCAYMGDEFAGSLGIFAGDGLCRFQEVAVRPKFQRQGIASTLVYHAAAIAQKEYPNNPQVIAADPNGDAVNIYNKLGFEKYSESHALITKQ